MKISKTFFNLQSGHENMVEMAMFNFQRAIIPTVDKSELWYMCSAHRLIVLYTCVKFRENITNCIRVVARTRLHGRNCYVQCSKGKDSISRQTRVLVHVFCTHGALHLCEIF